MNSKLSLPKPFFVLAPMDDVTDTVFRQIVASTAKPDLFFTEFTNVDGLQSTGRERVKEKLQFTAIERPLIAQLWGKNPENFYKTACEVADGTLAREFGLPEGVNFAGIDLNTGCPSKSEVQGGTCSALIKRENWPRVDEIIKAAKEGLAAGSAGQPMPLSIKTRLGFNEVDLGWHEFLLEHDLAMLTIHGRTRKEMSKVPAHWDLIGQVSELRDNLAPQTLIVGNGDILTREQGEALAKQYGLDGIMIGRGIFQDPFVFAGESPWRQYSKRQKLELFQRHVRLFIETWGASTRPSAPLNKFCKTYVNGFDGAKEFREQFMAAKNAEDLEARIARAITEA